MARRRQAAQVNAAQATQGIARRGGHGSDMAGTDSRRVESAGSAWQAGLGLSLSASARPVRHGRRGMESPVRAGLASVCCGPARLLGNGGSRGSPFSFVRSAAASYGLRAGLEAPAFETRNNTNRRTTMLTVKWVLKRAEGEITRIFDGRNVTVAYPDGSVVTDPESAGGPEKWLHVLYCPSPDGVIRLGKGQACLLIDPDDEKTAKRLAEGTCYVVNESGRTVGTYQLDDVDIHGNSAQKGIRSSFVVTSSPRLSSEG